SACCKKSTMSSKVELSGGYFTVYTSFYDLRLHFATSTRFKWICHSHGFCACRSRFVAQLKPAAVQAGRPEPMSVQAMHSTVSQGFGGRLDIVVNNAARMEPYEPFLDSDPDVYWQTWEVNVQGLFNMARTFLPMQLSTHASTNGSCIIINVSSSGALSARSGSGGYRTSKLAILRWTESLQLEYGDKGLLTFCVNPGAIKTKISEDILPGTVRDALPDRPDIAGDTIAWLAAERREWLGGRYVSCPWDMEELMKKKDEIVEKDQLKMRMVF
ncbi:hypothetical protein BDV10DRAFT_163538, partial [Aspergillus recurvatus]